MVLVGIGNRGGKLVTARCIANSAGGLSWRIIVYLQEFATGRETHPRHAHRTNTPGKRNIFSLGQIDLFLVLCLSALMVVSGDSLCRHTGVFVRRSNFCESAVQARSIFSG